MDTKIIQVLKSEWKGREGDTMEDFIGLGDDGLLYKWHKSSARWVLYTIQR